jgi:hypothetical protein
MFGCSTTVMRCSSCARCTGTPPIGRRSAASSMTTHNVSGSARCRTCCRRILSATQRPISSWLPRWWPRRMTDRA